MTAAAPRFIFILRHNLRLLPPSFSSHFRHHHRAIFSSISSPFSSLTHSPSPSPSLTSKLKLKPKASQHFHAQPSSSLGGTHPWPEFSRFLAHISFAGYTSTIPAADSFLHPAELTHAEVSFCLAFARDRPNLLRLLSMRDVIVVVEHGTPFLFPDSEDSVSKMKSFVSNGDSTALDTHKANMVDLMKFMLSYASNCSVSSESNSLYNRNLVESSVRNLFGELFKLSYSAPGPNSFDSVQNQMPGGRLGRSTMSPGQNIEMKKGDWICTRCNFMNFARNIKCLECEEARPKRQLTGGEWECPHLGNQAMMVSKVLLQRRLFRFLQLSSPSLCSFSSSFSISGSPFHSVEATEIMGHSTSFRSFCSQKSNLVVESHGPTPIDYSSLLQEAEFHRLAESTIQGLQEKFEDYGDSIDLDGFDIDYGNDVLTVKLGELGTYVLNKQTPNRQLWLSSPVSGPSRFDWDQDTKAWIYRRNKAKLYKILEDELEQLCGKPIVLS